MKRATLTATAIALTMFASAAPALDAGPHRALGADKKGQISDFPPKIPGNTDFQTTVRKMGAARWRLHSKKCFESRSHVCTAYFVSPCGVLATATFFGEKFSDAEVGGVIEGVNFRTDAHGSRSIRTLPTPPCPDEAGD